MAVGLPMKTTYADGNVLSAADVNDITGTVNLVGQTNNFYAGKNEIINGDFRFNQRSFTSNTANLAYNFDRFLQQNSGGSFTVTPQTFTPGAAPVTGYEGINFLRGITASQSAAGDYAIFTQRIEDVRTNANSTVVVSFWAKANTGTPKIGVELSQNFGSGGSPSAQVNTPAGSVTLSTSWARYSVSVAVPSISGKTIGTGSNSSYLELNLWTSSGATNATRASSIGIQNFTADIWGVQVERGSTATAFQTSSGSIEGELAACQRYYVRVSGDSNSSIIANGIGDSTTSAIFLFQNPVQMRIAPSSLEFTTLAVTNLIGYTNSIPTMTIYTGNKSLTSVKGTGTSGITSASIVALVGNASGYYFGLNAEL